MSDTNTPVRLNMQQINASINKRKFDLFEALISNPTEEDTGRIEALTTVIWTQANDLRAMAKTHSALFSLVEAENLVRMFHAVDMDKAHGLARASRAKIAEAEKMLSKAIDDQSVGHREKIKLRDLFSDETINRTAQLAMEMKCRIAVCHEIHGRKVNQIEEHYSKMFETMVEEFDAQTATPDTPDVKTGSEVAPAATDPDGTMSIKTFSELVAKDVANYPEADTILGGIPRDFVKRAVDRWEAMTEAEKDDWFKNHPEAFGVLEGMNEGKFPAMYADSLVADGSSDAVNGGKLFFAADNSHHTDRGEMFIHQDPLANLAAGVIPRVKTGMEVTLEQGSVGGEHAPAIAKQPSPHESDLSGDSFNFEGFTTIQLRDPKISHPSDGRIYDLSNFAHEMSMNGTTDVKIVGVPDNANSSTVSYAQDSFQADVQAVGRFDPTDLRGFMGEPTIGAATILTHVQEVSGITMLTPPAKISNDQITDTSKYTSSYPEVILPITSDVAVYATDALRGDSAEIDKVEEKTGDNGARDYFGSN